MHPSVKILSLIFLAIAVYLANPNELTIMAALLSALLVRYKAKDFLNLLRRMRWLLLFMVLVYAFNTPGEYVSQWPFDTAPTYEGIIAGLMQMTRIAIMLAGVSLLMTTTTRDNLMTGFFLVLYPLKLVGLNPERLAVRLWLTLHYVDQSPRVNSISTFLTSLDEAHQNSNTQGHPQTIRFESPAFSWKDLAAILAMLMTGLYLL